MDRNTADIIAAVNNQEIYESRILALEKELRAERQARKEAGSKGNKRGVISESAMALIGK
jgi:hypothetical protein